MQLKDFPEKQFIQEVLGPLATTAAKDDFDDAVVVDLADVTGARDAPFLVYSMDQPSFVRSGDTAIDPYRFYGRWIVGTTCNDVVAMGGRCRGFSLALAAPADSEVADITSLVSGINDALVHYGATYEGGNLDSGRLATVGFAWGLAPRAGLVRRSGARLGDRIAVTGELGMGWLEYQLRKHGLTHRIHSGDASLFTAYKGMPVGAAAAVAEAADHGWFTSGMDLSDGLVEFLYTVKTRNDLGCLIDYSSLPIAAATQRNLPLLAVIGSASAVEAAEVLGSAPRLVAFEPGYDSPLLHAFTVSPEAVEPARTAFRRHGAELHVIGEVVREPYVMLNRSEHRVEIPPFWDDQFRVGDTFTDWAKCLRALA